MIKLTKLPLSSYSKIMNDQHRQQKKGAGRMGTQESAQEPNFLKIINPRYEMVEKLV